MFSMLAGGIISTGSVFQEAIAQFISEADLPALSSLTKKNIRLGTAEGDRFRALGHDQAAGGQTKASLNW